jgi:hypothetical protein
MISSTFKVVSITTGFLSFLGADIHDLVPRTERVIQPAQAVLAEAVAILETTLNRPALERLPTDRVTLGRAERIL